MITGKPIIITNSMITSSSVSYPDSGGGETLWSSAVNYPAGAKVSYSINGFFHRFESKQGSNLNHIPKAYPNDETDAWWIDLGYVNKLAVFQNSRNTQTVAASPYSVKVTPAQRFGAIAIGNVQADSVTLEIFDGSTLIQTQTKALKKRDVYDWFSYTYEPFYQVRGTIFTDLPMNSSYEFRLVFTNESGEPVKVGSIIAGVPLDIGRALYGTSIRRTNFSQFKRDEFAETKIDIRRNIPVVNFNLIIDKLRLSNVTRLIDDLNGVVTFYAGIVETTHGYFDSVFLIGLYKDVKYLIDLPNHAKAEIEIEAL